jgi:5-methylcytosine-specific restriction endonuclease McrA
MGNFMTTRLHIRYRTTDGSTSDRLISELVAEPPNKLHAYCHTREERRTFIIERIEQAANADTGEIVSNIWLYLGIPSLAKPKPQMPTFSLKSIKMSIRESGNQRSTDKYELFKYFRLPVIIDTKKRQLFALFDQRCFHCGSEAKLVMDHHVPQRLGGRLVPGNVVALCSICNALKGTSAPADFYTAEQLKTLDPILYAELELFEFVFNWTLWKCQPKEYLLSLGVSEENALLAIANPGFDPQRPWRNDD